MPAAAAGVRDGGRRRHELPRALSVQLDDDDCDGKITARDIPEIVFSTFSNGAYRSSGVLHAISIVKGAVVEKWTFSGVHPTQQIAGGNVDGIPGNEVIACHIDGTVRAIKGNGTLLWSSSPMECFMPSIADLDGDGVPEVIVEGGILNGATGALKSPFAEPLKGPPAISDIDGDGKLEIVTGPQIFKADGALLVDSKVGETSQFKGTPDWKMPAPAIADFDKDGKPEIVVMHNLDHRLWIWRYDPTKTEKFTVVRSGVDINGALSPSLCPVGNWGNDDPSVRHSGIRVFGDSAGKWVRTRRVWNEHAYHITNVDEDGTIPKSELPNWTQPGLNNFRQNKQPGGEFAAPDAVVSIEPRCPGPLAIVATVRNLGESALPAGATVTLYKDAGTAIGTATTTLTLYPAEAESIVFTLGTGDEDVRTGAVDVWATVAPVPSVNECRADNNASPKTRAKCVGPK